MTKHKHYYAIRAYADGWKIECISLDTKKWVSVERPIFNEDVAYRVVPDENGWLPWYGGKCPLDGTVMVEVKYRHDIAGESDYAHLIHWGHLYTDGDVIAYRVIEEKADPYAELKAAAKDPTKQIRYTFPNGVSDGWHDYNHCWSFNGLLSGYEIRDKPKKPKMKLLAYIDGVSGELLWRLEGYKVSPYWKRAPSEDKEIEVEE